MNRPQPARPWLMKHLHTRSRALCPIMLSVRFDLFLTAKCTGSLQSRENGACPAQPFARRRAGNLTRCISERAIRSHSYTAGKGGVFDSPQKMVEPVVN